MKFIILFLAGLFSVFAWFFFAPMSFSKPVHAAEPPFHVESGAFVHDIISSLKERRLVRKYFPYRIFYRWSSFHAGEYRLSSRMSAYLIFKTLSEGKVITYDLTFPEGTNMFEMAQMLDRRRIMEAESFLKACHDKELILNLLGESVESLEGYLYPDTYRLARGMPARRLAANMVKEFFKNYEGLPSSIHSILSRHQVVILASLVEKETGSHGERARIASVFHNRLKKGMKFQSDPTILYGLLIKTGVMPHNIRKKDILSFTPYNTYTVPGFPKGPISNPGLKSLKAVLNPEDTDYYYFVSRNDGSHVFSKTLSAHNKAVDKYQRKKKK